VLSLLKAGSLRYWLLLRQPRPILTAAADADTDDDDGVPHALSETTPLLERNSNKAAAPAIAALSANAATPSSPRDTLLALHSSLLLHFHAHWMHLQSLSPEAFSSRRRPTVMDFERTIFVSWKAEVGRWLERGRLGGWVDGRGWIDDVQAREACLKLASADASSP
jgi:hypothetical protein